MAISPADITSAQNLLQQRAQLQSRLAQVQATQSLPDVLHLLDGVAPPQNALVQAQAAVTGYFTGAIADIEARLTGLGVSLS